MSNDLVPVSVSFSNIIKEIRSTDTPSKEVIISLTQAAHQEVIKYLAEDNMAGAIDTMEKTKAIEDYVKAKIRHQHGELYHGNLITAARFDMIREIGWWLDENLVDNGVTRAKFGAVYAGIAKKPKFFLKDLGIAAHQSEYWQRIARYPETEYREWLAPYLQDGASGKENELYFNRLLNFVIPKPAKEPEPEVVAELSPITKKFYLVLRAVKKAVITYFDGLAKTNVPTKDLLFLAGIILETRKGLAGAESKLRELAVKNVSEN